jgi:hypothetical protein
VRDLIGKLLKADPQKSDRAIANQIGSDHKTVGAKRKLDEERGEIPQVRRRTDRKGRNQPSHKSRGTRRGGLPPPDTRPRGEAPLEVAEEITPELGELGWEATGAPMEAHPGIARDAVKATAMSGFAAALKVARHDADISDLLSNLVTAVSHAKKQFTSLPEAQRIAAARGLLDALGVTMEHLKPINPLLH